MVFLRGMVHEGWHMVQGSKSWYDYIIMVRSGNAARNSFLSIDLKMTKVAPPKPL